MNLEKVYSYNAKAIYDLYVQKVMRKERSIDDLNLVLSWLTGYSIEELLEKLDDTITLQQFIEDATNFNEHANQIKGIICGVRVEDIEDSTYQKIRYMDKIVDELYKGKAIQKIMRGT